MPYHALYPAAPGDLSDNTVMDASVHPPRVSHAHYELDGWLGDDLVESYPCYFVTEDLADSLVASGIRSFELRDVEVTVSEDGADEIETVPTLKWLFVTGVAGRDDLGVTPTGRLVVSDSGLAALRQGNLGHCDVEEYAG